MHGMTRLLRVRLENVRLQLRPVFLLNPSKFEFCFGLVTMPKDSLTRSLEQLEVL